MNCLEYKSIKYPKRVFLSMKNLLFTTETISNKGKISGLGYIEL